MVVQSLYNVLYGMHTCITLRQPGDILDYDECFIISHLNWTKYSHSTFGTPAKRHVWPCITHGGRAGREWNWRSAKGKTWGRSEASWEHWPSSRYVKGHVSLLAGINFILSFFLAILTWGFTHVGMSELLCLAKGVTYMIGWNGLSEFLMAL